MNIALISLAFCLAAAPERMEWNVDGVTREALVATGDMKLPSGAPLVFVFHGHGGNMRGAARKFRLQELWPEAVVIYPQGLPTPTRLDPEGKRPGWQNTAGVKEDRDLKFFDAMLATAHSKLHVDPARIYVSGHSNGGGFTYLLWASRAKALAAVAPIAAGTPKPDSLAPLPAMHVAGRNDRIVPFAGQERTMAAVRRVDGCSEESSEWAKDCLLYPSKTGTPFVSLIHPGGHEVPDEAPPLVVRFFKEHAKAAAPAAATGAGS
jgi:polyhydroxybutyrate depolymerase